MDFKIERWRLIFRARYDERQDAPVVDDLQVRSGAMLIDIVFDRLMRWLSSTRPGDDYQVFRSELIVRDDLSSGVCVDCYGDSYIIDRPR